MPPSRPGGDASEYAYAFPGTGDGAGAVRRGGCAGGARDLASGEYVAYLVTISCGSRLGKLEENRLKGGCSHDPLPTIQADYFGCHSQPFGMALRAASEGWPGG